MIHTLLIEEKNLANWKDKLRGAPFPWLLEADDEQPAVRYFALKDLLGLAESDKEVKEAKKAIMLRGPVPAILKAQEPGGYWCQPGPGYRPPYRSTVWQIIFLAQLGADGTDSKVRAGCEYVLSHAVASSDGFSITGAPSGFIHCMAGDLAAALIDLGWLEDKRLQSAIELQAQMVTGEGIADMQSSDAQKRYYKSGTQGPLFKCTANVGLPCAWGAIKAMLALSKIPPALRSENMKSAIRRGIDFLLSHDPAVADYPFGIGKRPSSSWFRFGYPIGYITDVLQNLEVLCGLGMVQDPRLTNALEFVLGKQNAQGRWLLEYSYNGKMWVDIEEKRKPSKWVTLRALRVLKATYP